MRILRKLLFHTAPIISSQALGWKLLIVEEFQESPGGIDKPEAWKRHAIAIMLEFTVKAIF
ncbi:hypothetical protein [Chroococcidiopsis sp. TS-821]|uniref:hypothetical protein n=1 Tax=Chroococcidiopsis sp. TS-821 TaxID=1378066 RepID=UPI00143D7816|nr:hypothetical protein [Chroococcidiopsis sp. TS-821]